MAAGRLIRAAAGHQRGVRSLPDTAGKLVVLPLLRARRRRLRDTTFVAVTGSAGKTTTARLLAAVLERGGPTLHAPGGLKQTWWLARTLVAVRRGHRFCVMELPAFAPGSLDGRLWAYEPDVGVVTTVGFDHLSAFREQEAIAAEKSKLVESLSPSGLAVLNADDPRVRAIADKARAMVVLYGRSPDADVRAEEVRAEFPDRLEFTLVAGRRSHRVRTRLCGEVWVTAVLAALATGLELGIDLDQAVEAVAGVEPSPHRLVPLETPSGVTFLRDDWKGGGWTVPAALEVIASARARRKIVVLGAVPDDKRRPRALYRDLAREARRHAELVVVVGPWAHHGLRARASEDDQSIVAFNSAPEARAFLDGELEAGDLVLVKSARGGVHLERISLASVVPVTCTRTRCTKKIACDSCRLLTR